MGINKSGPKEKLIRQRGGRRANTNKAGAEEKSTSSTQKGRKPSPVNLIANLLARYFGKVLNAMPSRQKHLLVSLLVNKYTVTGSMRAVVRHLATFADSTTEDFGHIPPIDKSIRLDLVYRDLVRTLGEDSSITGEDFGMVSQYLRERRRQRVAFSRAYKAGKSARKMVFVLVVDVDDPDKAAQATGRPIFCVYTPERSDGTNSDPSVKAQPSEDGKAWLVNRTLPLRNCSTTCVDYVADRTVLEHVASLPEFAILQSLLRPERDSDSPLSRDEAKAFHAALRIAMNDHAPRGPLANVEKKLRTLNRKLCQLAAFARIDFRPWKGWTATSAVIEAKIRRTIKYRRAWKRGEARKTEGIAVGIGFRSNQQGQAGRYRNFKSSKTYSDDELLAKLLLDEDHLLNFLVGLCGGCIPSMIDQLQANTKKMGILGRGYVNVAMSLSGMKAFDAVGHPERLDDPDHSIAITLNAKRNELTPRMAAWFCYASVDKGSGLAFQTAPGVMPIFMAMDYIHGACHEAHPHDVEYFVRRFIRPNFPPPPAFPFPLLPITYPSESSSESESSALTSLDFTELGEADSVLSDMSSEAAINESFVLPLADINDSSFLPDISNVSAIDENYDEEFAYEDVGSDDGDNSDDPDWAPKPLRLRGGAGPRDQTGPITRSRSHGGKDGERLGLCGWQKVRMGRQIRTQIDAQLAKVASGGEDVIKLRGSKIIPEGQQKAIYGLGWMMHGGDLVPAIEGDL